jgi:hypothetical protein
MTYGQAQWPQPGPITAWRTLELNTSKPPLAGYWGFIPVIVRIDGFEHRPAWGPSRFTIPADRPVQVSCSMAWLRDFGRADYLLQPGEAPMLDYIAPAQQWVSGSLAPRGQAVIKGRGAQIAMYALLALIFIGIFALVPLAYAMT